MLTAVARRIEYRGDLRRRWQTAARRVLTSEKTYACYDA